MAGQLRAMRPFVPSARFVKRQILPTFAVGSEPVMRALSLPSLCARMAARTHPPIRGCDAVNVEELDHRPAGQMVELTVIRPLAEPAVPTGQ